MRILITGAAGFAATHLLRHLNRDEHELHGILLPGEQLAADLEEVTAHEADVRDLGLLERLLEDVKPDRIFHLAAVSRPRDCEQDPGFAWEVNFLGTFNLFQAAAEVTPAARVLFVGSSEVYGRPDPDELPLTEASVLRPSSVYAATKLAGELVAAELARNYRLAVIRVRPFNHIGPGQAPGFVAPDFARQAARIEKGLQQPVINVGNLDPQRDFTDVRDVARAYAMLIEEGRPGEVYNICSGTSHAVKELLDGLLSLIETEVEVVADQSRIRTHDVSRIVGSNRALEEATGWTPEITWDQTLRDLLDDWRGRAEPPA
jgi:GDP-4-dehydro-6-deoxy-D-mannose reductase